MATILCVDDDPSAGEVLAAALTRIGHTPIRVPTLAEALRAIAEKDVALVMSDYQLADGTGPDLVSALARAGFDLPVIMMVGYSSTELAVASMQSGAIDYLTKPVRRETVRIAVNQALEVVRLRAENETYRQQLSNAGAKEWIIGNSPAIRRVLETVASVAPTRATVSIQGEPGTGKELVARAIHQQSPRRSGPLVTVDCAALPEDWLESALFGHEKGAFAGAGARANGAFIRADGGTLVLDEPWALPIELQAKVLAAVRDQAAKRRGGEATVPVDVRVVVTSTRDLGAEAAAGRFRHDLWLRLAVVRLELPPLRDRTEDVAPLVHHFVRRAATDLDVDPPAIEPEAIAWLERRPWPGNVRELANAVLRAVILSRRGRLAAEAFADGSGDGAGMAPGRDREGGSVVGLVEPTEPGSFRADPGETLNLDQLERIAIERALRVTRGNRTRAAKLLGISERTLRNKLNGPESSTRSGPGSGAARSRSSPDRSMPDG